jgi:hypothetical protein
LFILYYLTPSVDINDTVLSEFETALQEAGCDLHAVASIKQIKSKQRMTSMANAISPPTSRNARDDGALLGRFSSFGNKVSSATYFI